MTNRLKQLLSLGSVYVIGGILERGISFLFLPLFTYYLAPRDYGIVGLMMLTINLITPLFLSPVNGGVYRFYYSPDYQDKRDQIIFNGLLFIFFQGAIFGTLMFLLKEKISHIVLDDISYSHVVAVFSFILMLRPISQYFMMLLQIQKRARLYIIISLSSAILFSVLVITLLTIFKMGFMALVYSHLIDTIYVIVAVFPFLLKYLKLRINLLVLKPILAYGYPLVVASLSVFLMQSADSFVLKIFSPLKVVGLYLFASKFTAIINLLVQLPVKKALVPLVLELESQPDQVRSFLYKTANYYCAGALFLWLILSIFSKEIIMLMAAKQEYWSAWVVVPILGFTSIIRGLNVYFNKGISLTNKTSLIALNHVIACLINIGLNFLFIPYWGPIGAAIATCCAILYFSFSNAYFSYRMYNLVFNFRLMAKIWCISFFIIILGLLCNNLNIIIAIIVKCGLVIIYPIFLFYTKIITQNHIHKTKRLVMNLLFHKIEALRNKIAVTKAGP